MEEVLRQRLLVDVKNDQKNRSTKEAFFAPPLSDADIIRLQNLLMTPAVHHIKTQNVATGRMLMNTFLQALKHYHHIGCFTYAQKKTLGKNIFNFLDLQRELDLADFFEHFFFENPQVDFAWIELTQDFKKKISDDDIETLCQILTAHGQTPVVVMNYEESI